MQKSRILTWSDMTGTATAQERIDQLNAEGYRIAFYGKSATENSAYNTVILVKEVETGKQE